MIHLKLNASHPLTFITLCTLLTMSGCKGDKNSSSDGLGGAGGQDGGAETSIGDQSIACETSSECDDALFCNGKEVCRDGFCRPGKPPTCDDGIECTLDGCDEEERRCTHEGPDEDEDGHVDALCVDDAGAPLGDDCDDQDALSYPGNVEVCDPEHRDEDCDPTTFGKRDADRDGYYDAFCCNQQDDGEMLCGRDCDDHKTNVNPQGVEVCDFLDNDCNGEVDEGVAIVMYPDTDHDGHGDDSKAPVNTCAGAVGYAGINDDCDDSDPEVFKGQFEICDGKDNNCDPERLADEIKEQAPWYLDQDGDTYGDAGSTPVFSCYRPTGRVLSQNDCDDGDKTVNPNATEICDAKDNDCNGWADAKAMGVNNFEDDDGDLVADADCGGDDCDDNDPRTAGGAEEVCDHIDNNCNGEVDEQTVQNIWYVDKDGDGWGVVIGSALASCDPIPNRASKFGDCDDSDGAVHPDVTETCDGIDNDCDGKADEGASAFCKAENAVSACAQGFCQIFSCLPGFSDANNEYGDGCEKVVDPVFTEQVCTAHSECNNGNICDGLETCFEGKCRLGSPINCDLGNTVIDGDVVLASGLDLKTVEGAQTITGDLIIDSTQLTSLIGLESLTTLGGSLIVRDNQFLTRLSGSALSNLETVGGDIEITGNAALTNADLPSLLYADSITIANNPALVNLGGYASLVEVGTSINITDNSALEAITGFDALGTIDGSYSFYYGEGHNGCRGTGGLLIESNFSLIELSAFSHLQVNRGDLCVSTLNYTGQTRVPPPNEAATMTTTLAFPELRELGGALVVPSTTLVGAIQLPQLESAPYVAISGGSDGETDALMGVSIPVLESSGYLIIRNTGCNLATVDLSSLKSADILQLFLSCGRAGGNDVEVNLEALEKVDSDFWLTGEDPKSYFAGANDRDVVLRVPSWTEARSINISLGSDALSDLTFPALKQVDYRMALNIYSLSLKSIAAPALESVGSDLEINAPVTGALELIDFPSLLSVGSQLNINAEMPVVSTGSGLKTPQLAVVGDADSDEDLEPDNNGTVTLCTGVFNQQTNTFDNAACPSVNDLIERGYVGQADTCDECNQNPLPTGPDVVQVVPSEQHTCALLSDSTVHCWGANRSGVLGPNAVGGSHFPVQVTGLSFIKQIAGGDGHVCALDVEGVVHCWGDNTYGQLGNADAGTSSAVPVSVDGVFDVTAITSGRDHMCALSGTDLYCWGRNDFGQLGTGQTSAGAQPAPQGPTTATAFVSAASHYTCALNQIDGDRLLCWGYGPQGQLGYDPVQVCPAQSATSPCPTPYAVAVPTTPSELFTSATHACVTTTNNELYCWGSDVLGEIGAGGGNHFAPQLVSSDAYTSYGLGTNFSCGVQNDAGYCWGANLQLQCSDPSNPRIDIESGKAIFANVPAPQLVPGLPPVASIKGGGGHACAITTDKKLYCWGDNRWGQLGHSNPYSVTIDNELVASDSVPVMPVEWTGGGEVIFH